MCLCLPQRQVADSTGDAAWRNLCCIHLPAHVRPKRALVRAPLPLHHRHAQPRRLLPGPSTAALEKKTKGRAARASRQSKSWSMPPCDRRRGVVVVGLIATKLAECSRASVPRWSHLIAVCLCWSWCWCWSHAPPVSPRGGIQIEWRLSVHVCVYVRIRMDVACPH